MFDPRPMLDGPRDETGHWDANQRAADIYAGLPERTFPGDMTMINRLLRAATVAKDRSGIAIVEFALLVPLLLTLFIGSFETANLLLAYLKLEDAAETAADLVAQWTSATTVMQSTDFTSITSAVQQVMSPLPTSGRLTISYASITFSGCSTTCTPKVDWVYPVGSTTFGAVGSTPANLPNGATTATLGTANTDSFVVVQLQYAYKSPVSYVLATNWTLTESAFNRPRYLACVPTYTNTNNTCP
jgi:Flp pilus assembly protein TadG